MINHLFPGRAIILPFLFFIKIKKVIIMEHKKKFIKTSLKREIHQRLKRDAKKKSEERNRKVSISKQIEEMYFEIDRGSKNGNFTN